MHTTLSKKDDWSYHVCLGQQCLHGQYTVLLQGSAICKHMGGSWTTKLLIRTAVSNCSCMHSAAQQLPLAGDSLQRPSSQVQ